MHRPVKVYDQLGDAYKQVVNSHGVRRPVSRTLCACGFTTYVTCLKDAWGSSLNIYAKNCQAWAHHGLLAQARGGHPALSTANRESKIMRIALCLIKRLGW